MSIVTEKLSKEEKAESFAIKEETIERQDEFIIRNQTDNFSFPVNVVIPGTSAATSGNYGVFWTAPFPCSVIKVVERHATAGTDGGTVTLDVLKVPSGTAAGSGTSVLGSKFNLKSTADTNQEQSKKDGNLAALANTQLSLGDSLALQTSGALTSVNHVCVTVTVNTQLQFIPE